MYSTVHYSTIKYSTEQYQNYSTVQDVTSLVDTYLLIKLLVLGRLDKSLVGGGVGCLRKALFSKPEMNTPESFSFWVTDTGNISFSTQIHCFHQVLAS